MKKLIFVILLIVLSSSTYAESNPFQLYKPNYIIAGNQDDQVKGQVSFKYALIYPENIGLYFGYSQLMFWDAYKTSSPFRDINFNPECFWFHQFNYGMLDNIQVGLIEHKSNGRDGEESKGWNRSYLRSQISYGTRINIGFIGEVFYLYGLSSNNEDIGEYIGFYEAELFIKFKKRRTNWTSRESIYIRGGSSLSKGWVEGGIKFRLVSYKIQPNLYLQVFHGYAESLLEYDEKETAIRLGVTME